VNGVADLVILVAVSAAVARVLLSLAECFVSIFDGGE